MQTKLKNIDFWILVPFILLSALGIVMVYSASSNAAQLQGLNSSIYLKRQALFVAVGFLLCAFFYFLKIDVLKRSLFTKWFLLIVLALLIVLLIRKHFNPQASINGASAWISIGPFHIQPLELAKLALILYLAKVYSSRVLNISQQSLKQIFSQLWPPVLVGLLITGLTMFQPDLGGAAIIAAIVFLMSFASGLDIKYVVITVIFLIILFVCGYFYFAEHSMHMDHSSYRVRRLMSFYHPFKLEKSGGSQLVNSYYAINNGGLWGRGLGNSIQKLGYLPEPYTDFILAIIAEELGLVGVSLVIGLLAVLIFRIVYLGFSASQIYLSLLCYGIAGFLFIQSAFNIGGVVGLLPITGVTLPFISYGGSSTLVLSICMGIVLNISVNLRQNNSLN